MRTHTCGCFCVCTLPCHVHAMRCHGNHSPPLAVLTDLGVLVAVRGTPGSSSLGKNAAFFSRVDGGTTFSASGTLVSAQVALPNDDCGVDQVSLSVVTSSSLIWPFIRRANKSLGKLTELQDGDLLPGTSIRVLMAGGSTPIWRHASLQGIYEVHGALQIAAGMACGQVPLANCGLGWKFGWRNSVDSLEDTSIDSKPPLPSQGDFLPLSGVCHIAVLRISTNNSNLPHQAGQLLQQLPWSLLHSRTARLLTQGEWLALSGSPYGALAPQLFLNTISVGVVSNLLSLADEVHPHPALVSVDARFMPGQEGGPVVDGNGNFIGIMTLPMRLSAEGTELPLMLSACSVRETLLATCSIYPGMQTRSKIKLQSPPAIYNHDLSSQWLASVVMIETEVGWGTGLVISACGTVITNAHVIAEATKIRVKIHHLGSQQWHAAAKIHAFEVAIDGRFKPTCVSIGICAGKTRPRPPC